MSPREMTFPALLLFVAKENVADSTRTTKCVSASESDVDYFVMSERLDNASDYPARAQNPASRLKSARE